MRMRNSKFPNLSAEMARIGILAADIAEVVDLSPKAVRDKINDKYPWVDDEMKAIRDRWFPGMTLDYLFACDNDLANKAG